ncbi:TetR family transcriptional regulator [Couchioplanes caeruleus]|uniref:TetR family transcriptional regulator n=1 Tax=Couchioplanes caeruleus TaxID=56438 RepID=A0A3N1GBH4_9ACTN|nr:TetR family transcriptional regulator [Couchioplanes caeruleus]
MRGRRTRERIVASAVTLMADHGVEATSLDQVLVAAGASKSQLYHYFQDKQELVRAVIAWQAETVLRVSAQELAAVDSWPALQAWFDALVQAQRHSQCRLGCPIGSLAAELADISEPARQDLAGAFDAWTRQLGAMFDRLRAGGLLPGDVDVMTLATATLATIQGGILLAKTTRDPERLRAALTATTGYLQALAPGA